MLREHPSDSRTELLTPFRLCIHIIHCGRVSSTAKNLANHRAKLCLLGLKELQKAWESENWAQLDLFFHCLETRTAHNVRLIDNEMSPSALSSQLIKGPQIPDTSSLHSPCSTTIQPLSPTSAESISPVVQSTTPLNKTEDTPVSMDWYQLFNIKGDDPLGLIGSCTSPDYLNPQNLEFLYRSL